MDTASVVDEFAFAVWPKVKHIEGWMTEKELCVIYSLARSLPANSTIVEIGTWVGRTAAVLGASGHAVFCVDPFDCSGGDAFYCRAVGFSPLLEWMKNAGRVANPVIGKSEKVVKDWTEPIDMLLIDGDHHYENVWHDLNAWTKHLKTGGILVIDDYYPEGKGGDWADVGEAAREFLLADPWQHLAIAGKLLITRKESK